LEKWKRDIIKRYPASAKILFASSRIKAFCKSEKTGRQVYFKDVDDRVKLACFRPASDDDGENDEDDESHEDCFDDATG
jgi:hypothetical protein